MLKQPWYLSHAETITQNVVGQIIAYIILRCYGIETTTGLQMQLTFFVVAYARGYLIRRFFNNYRKENRNELTRI